MPVPPNAVTRTLSLHDALPISGDITTDEELPNMGDVPLGVLTVFHYSAAADRPANKAFLAAWHKEYGANSVPRVMSVGARSEEHTSELQSRRELVCRLLLDTTE